MEYTEVKRAHIVPRFYLGNFAVDGQLTLHVDGGEHRVSIDDAAVRKTFYRRHRPDGTAIDDIEWSLSELESAIAPILGGIRENWPLPLEGGKGPLAEFFGFQLLRGPSWKRWREERTRQLIDELRRKPEPLLYHGLWIAITQKQINEQEDKLLSDTEWLTRMMVIANRFITILGTMRWHLVEFAEPFLAISDEPVVTWAMDREYSRAEPNLAGVGALNFLEVRAPISPTLALLMTWQDRPDCGELQEGTEEMAANLNAFTIANADRQWMSLPGAEVPVAEGYLDPISPQIVPGYRRAEAEDSEHRRRVNESVGGRLGQELTDAVDENGRMNAEIFFSEEHP